jgi:N-acetylmuramoyl-L-alanine amidase
VKKIIASSVLSTAFLFPWVVNAEELSLKDNVEVRKGATVKYPVVSYLEKGTELKVIDEFENANGETWLRIDLGEVKGWIPSSSTYKTNDSLIGTKATINTDNVNVRKGASTSYTSIDKLMSGTSVTVIDEFDNSLDETWYRIEFDGQKGWVLNELITIPTSTPTPDSNNKVAINTASVKKGATAAYDEVTTIKAGESVSVIDSFTNSQGELWYRVDLGAIKGWVNSSAFEEKETDLPPETKLMKVTVDSATIHKGATEAYDVVAKVEKSEELTVINSFKNASGDLWYRVDLGSVKGWIKSSAFETQTTPPPEKEDLPEYMYAKLNGIKVHSGATSSYKVVETLNTNQKVKILDSFTNSFNEKWIRVGVTEKLSGWVLQDSLSETASINKKLYISVDVANLRNGPSLNSLVVTQTTKGTAVTALKQEKDSNGDIWYNIYYDGKYVWAHESVVSSTSITLNKTINLRTQSGVLRSGATYEYSIQRYLSYNDRVTLLSEFVNSANQKWIHVELQDGTKGWMPEYEVRTDYTTIYALQNAVMRKGASANYSISAKLQPNQSLLVLRELNGWANVELENGERGWVLKNTTSSTSIQVLTQPTTSITGNDTYLNWKKPTNFDLNYSSLASNKIRIFGGLTDLSLPSSNPKGISSIEPQALSNGDKAMIVTFAPGYTYTIRDYNDKLSIKILPKGLKGKKIIVDAGHGDGDNGATGVTGLREKVVNLYTAIYLKEELERAGATVILTRSDDTFLELSERTDIANNSDYDAFVSIHSDSFTSTSRGSTTYYNKSVNFNGPKSYLLGEAVQSNLVSQVGTANRGVHEQLFYVNRMNELPSVLVELAFLSNPSEEALLKTESFRRQAALGIRKGLEEYFNY